MFQYHMWLGAALVYLCAAAGFMVYSLLLCCLPVRSLGASLVPAPDCARTVWIFVDLDMRAQYGGPCLRSERRGLAAPGP